MKSVSLQDTYLYIWEDPNRTPEEENEEKEQEEKRKGGRSNLLLVTMLLVLVAAAAEVAAAPWTRYRSLWPSFVEIEESPSRQKYQQSQSFKCAQQNVIFAAPNLILYYKHGSLNQPIAKIIFTWDTQQIS